MDLSSQTRTDIELFRMSSLYRRSRSTASLLPTSCAPIGHPSKGGAGLPRMVLLGLLVLAAFCGAGYARTSTIPEVPESAELAVEGSVAAAIDSHAEHEAAPTAVPAEVASAAASVAVPRAAVTAEPCSNGHVDCEVWATQGECTKNKQFMWNTCRKACALCAGFTDHKLDVAAEAETSRPEHVEATGNNTPPSDKNKLCVTWAKAGECKLNPTFMLKTCQHACASQGHYPIAHDES